MPALSRADLWSLEEYSEVRPAFRSDVMAHKKNRQLALGEHARLYFEDLLTIKYQIQEMLRIEKVFEAAGINEELEAYNPLIPDGHNWKATFMIEYEDPAERAETRDHHRHPRPAMQHVAYVAGKSGRRRSPPLARQPRGMPSPG